MGACRTVLLAMLSLAMLYCGAAFQPGGAGALQCLARPPAEQRPARAGGGAAHRHPAAWSRGVLSPALRASNENASGGEETGNGEGDGRGADLARRMANVPILGIFVRFAQWIASLLRSILIMRITVLCQAMNQLKTALLDPQRRLSAPGHLPLSVDPKAKPSAGQAAPLAASAATTDGTVAPPADAAKKGATGIPGADWEPVTSSEVAFKAFWTQMDELSSNPSVQGELVMLQAESARQRKIQEQELALASGVQLSVLDFVENGGLPPSVEALTAWLEIRDIDTSLWGCGEAKTVQEFFHELWAGESEQLGRATQRVISVVKVRILDTNEQGTWQLYETKQDCCVRGVREELGSLVGKSKVLIREGTLQHWEETRMSKSFPGLETLYKLYQLDVEVQGLTMKSTGEIFDTEEDPTLSTGKVHRWQWVPCGGVDWDPVSTG